MRRAVAASFVVVLFGALLIPQTASGGTSSMVSARAATTTMRWSDPATWGGTLPGPGSDVQIPYGATVLLDTDTSSLGGLSIDGTLKFARRDLKLTAEWIMVHGSLKVGSAGKPFTDRAVITLTGSDLEADVMGMGTRFLGVMGGSLDLHGRKTKGWTRLAATAEAGDATITLDRPMGWGPGDQIVIASTDYWSRHDEVRTITRVEGAIVELDEPLTRMHWGVLQDFEGQAVDERAEVGLLTRNIVIRPKADALAADGFGGHVMLMEGAEARIEGVEFEDMGQKGLLRKYPVHFHMDGAASGSYLKNSVIDHSFNRCVTIHGTTDLLVKGNVCSDHIGHGFFLEDGAETDNRLIGNLGLGTRSTDHGLLQSDKRAATFWITNPDNVIRNNVAAGSEGIGFWYALPEHPTGLSESDSIWPRRTNVTEFRGNVAHSNGDVGLNVDHGPTEDGTTETTWYSPRVDPTDEDSEKTVARFESFTAYMNRDRGIWLRGENHLVTGAVLADNRAGATFAASEDFLEDSLVVGETANPGTPEDWEEAGPDGGALPFFWDPTTPIVGFEFYDGRVGVRNTTFVGFRENSLRPSGALGYLAPNAFSIDPKNFAEGVTFVDSTPVYLAPPEPGMDGDLSKVFVDADGSVTGTPGDAVVVDNPFLLDDSCAFQVGWNAHVCSADYVSLMVGGPNADSIKPVTLARPNGVEQVLMGCCEDSDDAWTSVLVGDTYRVAFNGGTPKQARFVLYRGTGRWVRLAIPVPSAYKVTRWGQDLKQVTGSAALDATNSSAWFHDPAAGLLQVKIYGHGSWEEIRIQRP